MSCKEKQQPEKLHSEKITAPVAVEQFPRQSRRVDPPVLNEGTSSLQLQELGNECSNQEQRGQAEERVNWFYWTVWIQ